MSDHQPAAAVHITASERNIRRRTTGFRWIYIPFRTVMLGLEISTLGYLIWLSKTYSFRTGHYSCAFAAVVLGLILDAAALGVLVFKRDLSVSSGTHRGYFNCGDVVVLIVTIIGWLLILFADFNMEQSPPRMPYNDYEDVGCFMIMGIWIAHFVLSVLNCVEHCAACGQAGRAKRQTRQVVYLVPVVGSPQTRS